MAAQANADAVMRKLAAGGEAPVRIGAIEPGRGVKSQAKGKGESEAVRYSAKLGFASDARLPLARTAGLPHCISVGRGSG